MKIRLLISEQFEESLNKLGILSLGKQIPAEKRKKTYVHHFRLIWLTTSVLVDNSFQILKCCHKENGEKMSSLTTECKTRSNEYKLLQSRFRLNPKKIPYCMNSKGAMESISWRF